MKLSLLALVEFEKARAVPPRMFPNRKMSKLPLVKVKVTLIRVEEPTTTLKMSSIPSFPPE